MLNKDACFGALVLLSILFESCTHERRSTADQRWAKTLTSSEEISAVQPEHSLILIDSLFRTKEKVTDETMARALISKGVGLFDTDNEDEGVEVFEEGMELAQSSGYSRGLAYGNFCFGSFDAVSGDIDKAVDRWLASLAQWKPNEDTALVEITYRNLGRTLRRMGEYEEAELFHEKLLHTNATGIHKAQAYSELGEIQMHLGRRALAIEYLDKSLIEIDSVSFPITYATCRLKKALVTDSIVLIEQALQMAEQIHLAIPEDYWHGELSLQIMKSHLRLENRELAEFYSANAVELSQEYGSGYNEGLVHLEWADYLIENQEFYEASKAADKAFLFFADYGGYGKAFEALSLLQTAQTALGDKASEERTAAFARALSKEREESQQRRQEIFTSHSF